MSDVTGRLTAALADRYRLERELGQGGMATVYLADDVKHHRKVAIKVLRPELAAALGAERFLREIETTANLRHPHILPLYDSGEAGEFLYYVMPYVEGESLRGRLDRERQLPVDDALLIAQEVGDALSYAHTSGVIHRDIKPENILLERGHAVVADFGVARALTSAGGEKLTQTGLAIGTPLYMSPEQASGVEAVDTRSDLYSLACVLYEMLAGQPPFTGPSVVAVIARHALDSVPPLRTTRPGLSTHLAGAVEKALAKTPADRYPTVAAWREALTQSARASASTMPADLGAVRTEEGFWVAVLPFRYAGADPDLTALAEGLSEEIITGLSRFSYLRVVARGAALRHTGEGFDVREAARDLGARYVMEGSLRQAGTRLRVAVQLIDATTGAHLWAENYERTFSPEGLFELQDELVPRIVSTIADMHGVLPRIMGEILRSRAPEQLSPYEALLRSFGYPQRGTAQELAVARSGLELAVQRAPAHGDAWGMLAFLCVQDYAQGFDLQPDSLKSGLVAARRAVEAAPSSHLAHLGLAQALFFHREFQGFRNAAERAVALNPMDGHSIAFLGELLCYAGHMEPGLALAERAKQLNPHHPGWYWAADFYDAYRRSDYPAALGFALRDNMPGHWAMHAMLAAAHGQLGQHDAAANAIRDLLAVRPDFAATARKGMRRWWQPEYVEHLIDGWRKAGLEVAPDKEAGALVAVPVQAGSSPPHASDAAPAEAGFCVAVLPFRYAGADPDLTALAEGLCEEIITGLSRFSYLRVVARGAALRHTGEGFDVRDAARDLGARYVMEGSLRQVGTSLRVAVQLIDATTSAHLWAENYERRFRPETAFELRDDLSGRIVSTFGDRFGALARSISEAVRNREPGRLGPYEALMRGFGYHHRLTPVEHSEARDVLERAVVEATANADCWAMLSWIYSHEHAHGFNTRPGSLDRALTAARRAVDLAQANQLAQQALAVVLFFRKETAGCLSAAERAIALNPLDASNEAIFLITFTGNWERGCELIRRAMELNPHHPRWYELVLGINQYRMANYRTAVDEVVKANARDVFWTNVVLAAAYGQLGEVLVARAALQDLLAQKEDFAQSGAQLLGRWFDAHLVGHLMEGLRKAGLDVPFHV